VNIVVVGAGVAGLAAAFAARREGHDVLVLEASARTGGLVETERAGGLLMEHGAETLVEGKAVGMRVIAELGLGDELVREGPAPRRTFIATDRGLFAMPDGGIVPRSPWPLFASSLLSARAKWRLLREPFVPAARGDETVAAFGDRRLGREARATLVDPMMRAIYGVPSERLEMRSALPHLASLERTHGSLARAMLGPRRAGSVATLRRGMSTLADALAAAVGRERVRLGCSVRSIERSKRGFTIYTDRSSLAAGAVVLAVPAWRAASLVAPIDSQLAAELSAIQHVDANVVSLAYPRAAVRHALDGTGHLAASGDATRACTWASAKWAERAPDGVVLLRAVLDEVAAPDELVAIARREVERALDIDGAPVLVRLRRRPRALPVPGPGHAERRARIAAHAHALSGLAIAGAGEGALGVPDCIASGLRAFHAVAS
jgi:oxygen-dependent protoporphyrinogen oxidase